MRRKDFAFLAAMSIITLLLTETNIFLGLDTARLLTENQDNSSIINNTLENEIYASGYHRAVMDIIYAVNRCQESGFVIATSNKSQTTIFALECYEQRKP